MLGCVQVPATHPAQLFVPSSRIERRRPGLGRWLLRFAFIGGLGLPALALLVAAIFSQLRLHPPSAFLLLGGLVVLVGLLFSPIFAVLGPLVTSVSLPRPHAATLQVNDAGILIVRAGDDTWIAREQIEAGLVLPGKPRPAVALHLRSGDVLTVEVEDGPTAHRLLDRLGIDAERRRVSISFGSVNRQLLACCVGAPIIFTLGLIPLGMVTSSEGNAELWSAVAYLGGCVLATLLVSLLARPREVVVGSDGVRIRAQLFGDRWIPHAIIEEVMGRDTSLLLRVRGPKRREDITIARGKREVVQALENRIRLAMALGSNGGGGPSVGELLDPQGRPLAEWREALGKLFAPAPDYRRAPVALEDLLAVVEDPDLPPGRRIGAAMALRVAGHPEARSRIRVAAEACADDDVRHALAEAAEGEIDDRTLRRALH